MQIVRVQVAEGLEEELLVIVKVAVGHGGLIKVGQAVPPVHWGSKLVSLVSE